MESVRALFFDVFGTCVDWRTTVTSYLVQSCHTTLSSSVTSLPSMVRARASTMTPEDWASFAQEWRDSYYAFTNAHSQEPPSSTSSDDVAAAPTTKFLDIDTHHYHSLRDLLAKHSLAGLWDDSQLYTVSQIWHRLNPWPDSAPGLNLLAKRFPGHLSTLSNGNTALLKDLTAFAALPFDHLLSAEDFRTYKPNPKVYRGAAERLGLEMGQCAMVAAHLKDLKAANELGMRTVYVERTAEENWGTEEVEKARTEGWVDVWVELGKGDETGGFVEVARLLGVHDG